MRLYIVTNIGGGKNYTPSVFKSRKKARKWMIECTKENAKDVGVEPEIYENITYVGDEEDGGNVMQLFEVNV